MSTQTLYRWAAVALIATGISLALGMILHPDAPFAPESIASPRWAAAHFFWWLGGMLGIAGLAGLYLRQREAVGILGFAGAGLAAVGSALIACAMYFEAFMAPGVADRAPELVEGYPAGGGWEGFLAGVLASGALIGLGFLLFGIAMFRAGTMPRWAIVAAVIGGIPFGVNFLLPTVIAILAAVVFGAGLAGFGYTLWTEAPEPGTAQA